MLLSFRSWIWIFDDLW